VKWVTGKESRPAPICLANSFGDIEVIAFLYAKAAMGTRKTIEKRARRRQANVNLYGEPLKL
jgi:hypothetical protein